MLTEAGRFYRTEGKPTKAMDYFRAAVAAENAAAAQAGAAMPGLAPTRPGSGFDRVPGNPSSACRAARHLAAAGTGLERTLCADAGAGGRKR